MSKGLCSTEQACDSSEPGLATNGEICLREKKLPWCFGHLMLQPSHQRDLHHPVKSFLKLCSRNLKGVTEDAQRTKDRRQTCIKLGPSVLGARMEMHNGLVTSFLYYSLLFLCFFSSLFFQALLLYFSLKPCFFSILQSLFL
jgi:hypothetical protein